MLSTGQFLFVTSLFIIPVGAFLLLIYLNLYNVNKTHIVFSLLGEELFSGTLAQCMYYQDTHPGNTLIDTNGAVDVFTLEDGDINYTFED
jgi:hypothetical protein